MYLGLEISKGYNFKANELFQIHALNYFFDIHCILDDILFKQFYFEQNMPFW